MLSVLGCLQSLQEAQKLQGEKRAKLKEQERTFQRPKSKPIVSKDGLKFETEHYILTFAENIEDEDGYETTEERIARGSGAILFLEGQYDFVKNIFGFDAKNKIKVKVEQALEASETLDGDEPVVRGRNDARALINKSVKRVGNHFVTNYDITVYFGIEAFKERSVQAHELTHAFTSAYALPAWLDEGIAVFVESEYAGGAGWAKMNRNLTPIEYDKDGFNVIQNWRGHGSALPGRSIETYAYAYSIVYELRKRYGDDLFKKFFALVEKDGIHHRAGTLSSSVIAYYMSQAVGRDVVPFFKEINFNVRKLTKEDIVSILGG